MGKLGFESVVLSSSGNSMFGVHFPEKKLIVNCYITNSLAYFLCAHLSWLPRAVVLKRSYEISRCIYERDPPYLSEAKQLVKIARVT